MKNRLTCREAVKKAILELGGGPVTAEELFSKVKSMGNWSNNTIWQHLMHLVINLPPAYRHWPNTPERFLYLREDGRYELYHPEKHGIYSNGVRIKTHPNEECNTILEKYVKLMERLKTCIVKLCTMKTVNVTDISTKHQNKTGVYVFLSDRQAEYIGSTNNLYRRLKHDLWGSLGQQRQPHVFGRKILREYDSANEARNYLKNLNSRSLKLKTLKQLEYLSKSLYTY